MTIEQLKAAIAANAATTRALRKEWDALWALGHEAAYGFREVSDSLSRTEARGTDLRAKLSLVQS